MSHKVENGWKWRISLGVLGSEAQEGKVQVKSETGRERQKVVHTHFNLLVLFGERSITGDECKDGRSSCLSIKHTHMVNFYVFWNSIN